MNTAHRVVRQAVAYGHRHKRKSQEAMQQRRGALGERSWIEESNQRLAEVREPFEIL